VARLARWWEVQGRALPWRRTRDPYAVLVSEVMSHQTQIARVVGHWTRWMQRWPRVSDLAAAGLADVLREWQGLGYPRRARDLHAAARMIDRMGWPAPERLTELPGVGAYTASALRCFAFEQAELPADANVRRVLARRFPHGIDSRGDAWRLGQAVMEFGQLVCRVRARCSLCPLRGGCAVAAEHDWDPASAPRRQAAYRGSLRERRGRLLRAVLAGEAPVPSRDAEAARSLTADGLAVVVAGRLLAPR
jgi:A/G-specific adenine glycosylase